MNKQVNIIIILKKIYKLIKLIVFMYKCICFDFDKQGVSSLIIENNDDENALNSEIKNESNKNQDLINKKKILEVKEGIARKFLVSACVLVGFCSYELISLLLELWNHVAWYQFQFPRASLIDAILHTLDNATIAQKLKFFGVVIKAYIIEKLTEEMVKNSNDINKISVDIVEAEYTIEEEVLEEVLNENFEAFDIENQYINGQSSEKNK